MLYDPASLTCQTALGGTALETSRDVGWRCALLERRRWEPGSVDLEGHPTSDMRVAIASGPSHHAETLVRGRWERAHVPHGSIGITAPGKVDRLRWHVEISLEAISLHVPGAIMSSAMEHLRCAGTQVSKINPARSVFGDGVVAGVVESLLGGMRRGVPELFAEQTAHWLAMHLAVQHTADHQGLVSVRREELTDRRLVRVIDLIRARYADQLSLDELASEACVSKFHFARLFRARTGLSPHAYLLAERMKVAQDLLLGTDLQVSEVARRAGYPRASSFATAFKEANGTTPSRFRAATRR